MVIATGGSAAYSPQAMRHLHASGTILYLQADVNVLLSRINDMSSRGIAKAQNQSFEDLYKEREALYRAHADIEIACGVMNHGQVLEVIVAMLKKNNVK
jgi:shikimate kinase